MGLFIMCSILAMLIALHYVAKQEAAGLALHEQAHRFNWGVSIKYTEKEGKHLFCYGLYVQYRDELKAKGEPYSYCINQAYIKMIRTLECNNVKAGELFYPFNGQLTLLSEILLKRVSFVD